MLLLGPLRLESWLARIAGLVLVALTMLVAQLAAIAVWLGLGVHHEERPVAAKAATTALLWLVVWAFVMPAAGRASGRVPLPCNPWSGALRPHSALYCITGRNYVDPRLAELTIGAAADLAAADASFVVRYLDGGFPVGRGFPLLPHLTHGDGRRLDLMLQYRATDGTPATGNGSPIGYWGYVPPTGRPACPPRWDDLRWDMEPLQPLLSRNELDDTRSRRMLARLLADGRMRKVLVEPHLQRRLGLHDERIRFQGCGAARHDDHIHIQL